MLHCASFIGNIEIVEYLVSKGADLGSINCQGRSPVQLAEEAGHH